MSGNPDEVVPQVTVVAQDGRRIGVRVLPFRCTTILAMLDLDDHPWTFSRGNLPPTTNAWIHAVADFTAEQTDYHWDTPRYRELCIAGGLDPDHHRPRFGDEDAHAGEALVRALCRQGSWPDHDAVAIVLDLVDVMRTDRWRGSVDVETLQGAVRFHARHRPIVVEQALSMITHALGDSPQDIRNLLGIVSA